MTRETEWHEDMIFFRKIVEEANILAWITFEDGCCVYHSPGWCAFTGISDGSGDGFGWLELVHPDDSIKTRKAFFDAIDREAEYGLAYRLRKFDGSYQMVWGHGVPRRSNDCSFLGYLGMTQPMEHYTDKVDELAKVWTSASVKPISEREREVLVLVAEGQTNDQIARKLDIHVRTVEQHVHSFTRKLGANNRVHAVAKALKLNEI